MGWFQGSMLINVVPYMECVGKNPCGSNSSLVKLRKTMTDESYDSPSV